MRYKALLLLVVAASLAGCGGAGAEERAVPDVVGMRLDKAENLLADHELDYEEVGGGGLGVLVRSNWRVCRQEPAPGKLAKAVELHVARECPPVPPPPPPPPSERVPVVPQLVGEDLEDAKDSLRAEGIAFSVNAYGDDTPVVDRLWEVCYQDPPGGVRSSFVELTVDHECFDW